MNNFVCMILLCQQLLWIIFLFPIPTNGCVLEERKALMEIKYSLMRANATAPKSWIEGTDCCLWEHIRCEDRTARVSELSVTSFYNFQWKLNFSIFSSFKELTSLDLFSNDFDTSPSLEGISQLTKLQYLNLGYNGFTGNIPLSLGNISSLQILNLEGNLLSGSLPDEVVRNLPNLRELYLTYNQINGSLPPSLFELQHLEHVHISSNLFQGNIPRGLIANLTSLRSLDLSNNDFDGHFSFLELTNLSKLTEINLSNNNNLAIQVNYPGCEIAPSLQLKLMIMSSCNIEQNILLTPKFLKSQVDLEVLDLSHNKLLGPSSKFIFLNNTKLKYLNLRNNSLDSAMNLQLYPKAPVLAIDLSQNNIVGLIPNNISLMFPHLISLNISRNKFSGNVPLSLCKLNNMFFLDLSNNSFSGEIPNCIFTNCTSLWILKLSDNNFNGKIFGGANNLPPSLSRLYLDGNNITGSFPANLPTNKILSVLDVHGNQLSGSLPQSIGNLYHIRILNLAGNNLNGLIPHQLCNLTSLDYLDLTGNNFNGSMPFCSHPLNIRSVFLSSNALEGSPPYHTFNFSTMEVLDLSKNQFSGSLHWIEALEAIRLLSVRENQFGGTLSQNICQLNNLRILDLSGNNLEGILPLCLFKLPFQAAPGYVDYFWELTNEFTMYSVDSWKDVSIDVVYSSHDDLQQFSFTTKGSFYTFSTGFFGLLSGVDLSRNKFSGLIPPDIRNMIPIQVLNLSHNLLSGPIPKTIAHFSHIESLDLSYNQLTGSIPWEMTRLDSLSVLSLAHNNLLGCIPDSGGQFSTFNSVSFEGNIALHGLPLDKNCSSLQNKHSTDLKEREKTNYDVAILWAIISASFVLSFWLCIAFLYLCDTGRHVRSHIIDGYVDEICTSILK